jgi:hypothetical protein
MEKSKKITLATVKKFIMENKENLLISRRSDFDGMTDCVTHSQDKQFYRATFCEPTRNTLGVEGAWFVGQSRDWFNDFNDGKLNGIKVNNCCGSFILATEAAR